MLPHKDSFAKALEQLSQDVGPRCDQLPLEEVRSRALDMVKRDWDWKAAQDHIVGFKYKDKTVMDVMTHLSYAEYNGNLIKMAIANSSG